MIRPPSLQTRVLIWPYVVYNPLTELRRCIFNLSNGVVIDIVNVGHSLNKKTITIDWFVVGWSFCVFEKRPEK